MKIIAKRSLWEARRGWRVGERGYVGVWDALLPSAGLVLPHLSVCTLADVVECGDYTSSIWAIAPEGRAVAERMARDLLAFGFTWGWPHEADWVRILVAPMHHLHEIGAMEAAHG